MTLSTPSDNMPYAAPPPTPGYPRLVGDIGGTHARFATIDRPGAPLSDFSTHACAGFTGIEPLLQARLARGGSPRPVAGALGVATPVTGDVVRMTNLDWSFSIAALQTATGLPRLMVINDFESLARGLPGLQAAELRRVGGGVGDPAGTRAVLGPGTGLGVAGLTAGHDFASPVVGEGGHVTLAAEDDLEDQILRVLRERFGHVSAERVLSGPGLVNLYAALCTVHGVPAEALVPSDVTARALASRGADADPNRRGPGRTGGDTSSDTSSDTSGHSSSDIGVEATVDLSTLAVTRFLGWLGAVAGDLALTLGARGGVYIGGGIAVQMLELIEASPFRERFENKGRFRGYLADVPTWLITDASDAALRGASAALDAAFRIRPPAA